MSVLRPLAGGSYPGTTAVAGRPVPPIGQSGFPTEGRTSIHAKGRAGPRTQDTQSFTMLIARNRDGSQMQLHNGTLFFVNAIQTRDKNNVVAGIPHLNYLLEEAAKMQEQGLLPDNMSKEDREAVRTRTLNRALEMYVWRTKDKTGAAMFLSTWGCPFSFGNDRTPHNSGKNVNAQRLARVVAAQRVSVRAIFAPIKPDKVYRVGQKLFLIVKEVDLNYDCFQNGNGKTMGPSTTSRKVLQVRGYAFNGETDAPLPDTSESGENPNDYDSTYWEANRMIRQGEYFTAQPDKRDPSHFVWAPASKLPNQRAPTQTQRPRTVTKRQNAIAYFIGTVSHTAPIPSLDRIRQAWRNSQVEQALPLVEINMAADPIRAY